MDARLTTSNLRCNASGNRHLDRPIVTRVVNQAVAIVTLPNCTRVMIKSAQLTPCFFNLLPSLHSHVENWTIP